MCIRDRNGSGAVMKIAQITSVYISVPPRTHGGTERVVYHLCQQLDRRGHHVELFASGDSQVTCRLQAVLPVATQYDPQSTFYLEKEYECLLYTSPSPR